MNKGFYAEVIADSDNGVGQRLTTFIITFPRIILAEFNTHRVFSRNSASSRAIPFEKMVKGVEENPFIPIKWMKDHSGMQGDDYWSKKDGDSICLPTWMTARDKAVETAKALSKIGLTKQFCNRLLEPFMWHTVIVTSSEWENFFALRSHESAEIHMQKIADMMLVEYNKSKPKKLKKGEWHIPFGEKMDNDRITKMIFKRNDPEEDPEGYRTEERFNELSWRYKVKIAVARCARLSYLNYEGKDDYIADVKLHDRLFKMGHFSPFEHCATAVVDYDKEKEKFGNFDGFVQYRKTFKDESRQDDRVKKK